MVVTNGALFNQRMPYLPDLRKGLPVAAAWRNFFAPQLRNMNRCCNSGAGGLITDGWADVRDARHW
jgi:hypothetical protein